MIETKNISSYFVLKHKTTRDKIICYQIDDNYREEYQIPRSCSFIALFTPNDILASTYKLIASITPWSLSDTGKEQEFKKLGFTGGYYLGTSDEEINDFEIISHSLANVIEQIENELV
jgi:hypothetical protein